MASLQLVRTPAATEAVTVMGYGLAEGIRRAAIGNKHLSTFAATAALDRIERYETPIATQVGIHFALVGPDGPMSEWVELCWPTSQVSVALPPMEGIIEALGIPPNYLTFVAVERRWLGLIDDPWTYWPDFLDPELPADNRRLFALLDA